MTPPATDGAVAPLSAVAKGEGPRPEADAPCVLTREEELAAYHDMLLVRRFEEKAGQLYSLGVIGGFCHLCIGQEAVVVGVQRALQPGDQVIATHRSHGQMLAAGVAPRALMAELAGKGLGASRGKGGSMHVFARDKGFYGGHGIVGATGPLGTGIAFANRYRDSRAVTVSYMGEAALLQGQVAEAFELAAMWKLPVVFVIENNAAVDALDDVSASDGLTVRGVPYGIPGTRVDGMDVATVRDATLSALAHARSGKGPFILEMLTVSYRGHSVSDPEKYAARADGDKAQSRERIDPLERVRARLIGSGSMGEDDFKAVDRQVRALVNAAAQAAREAPEPDPTELLRDVALPC